VQRTILCLINSAAFSRPYFEQLAPLLERAQYQVVFALDSHLTDVQYAGDRALPNAWYFTDFIRAHAADFAPSAADAHSWSSLLSDFDRFLTMDIPSPLRPDAGVGYRQIPALLEAFFARVFTTERPCAVLYEQVSNSFAIAAYRESLRAGIPFCSLCPSRIAGRIEVSMTGAFEDYRVVAAIQARAAQGSISKASYDIATEYILTIDQQVPDYMRGQAAGQALAQLSLRRKYLRLDKIRHAYRNWHYRTRFREDCRLAYQHGDPIVLSYAFVKRALKRRLRSFVVSRHYSTKVYNEPFVLYPLHSHPEASTSVLAADFIDELSVIRSIAFRLPVGVRLYVKEHPSAIAAQPTSFYRQVSELPNVHLLAAHVVAKDLIRKSRGVVCITSTLGFEAAVLNKPVIAFGDVLYGYYPNVRMIRDYSALDDALRWMLDYQPISSEELLRATAAYVEFGSPGSFDFFASLGDRAALQSVADAVVSRLDAALSARAAS
jgi:hypothetical protein